MKIDEAKAYLKALRKDDDSGWKNRRHVATMEWRDGVVALLSRDSEQKDDGALALIEVFLAAELPQIDRFLGIFKVDERGLWYFEDKTSLQDRVSVQRFIPWNYIMGITMHENKMM